MILYKCKYEKNNIVLQVKNIYQSWKTYHSWKYMLHFLFLNAFIRTICISMFYLISVPIFIEFCRTCIFNKIQIFDRTYNAQDYNIYTRRKETKSAISGNKIRNFKKQKQKYRSLFFIPDQSLPDESKTRIWQQP